MNFYDKKERRQAERKWRNTKLTIFMDFYRQAKHKVSNLVHTAKCQFYTERIALASSSKELHQIDNTLSNRHLPKILPAIYPSADLHSLFIKHITSISFTLSIELALTLFKGVDLRQQNSFFWLPCRSCSTFVDSRLCRRSSP